MSGFFKYRAKLLYTGTRRFQFDGLNSLQYKLISIQNNKLFTHILVDIGKPPKGFWYYYLNTLALAMVTLFWGCHLCGWIEFKEGSLFLYFTRVDLEGINMILKTFNGTIIYQWNMINILYIMQDDGIDSQFCEFSTTPYQVLLLSRILQACPQNPFFHHSELTPTNKHLRFDLVLDLFEHLLTWHAYKCTTARIVIILNRFSFFKITINAIQWWVYLIQNSVFNKLIITNDWVQGNLPKTIISF